MQISFNLKSFPLSSTTGFKDNATSGEVYLDPRPHDGGNERERERGRKAEREHGGRHHKYKHKNSKHSKQKKISKEDEEVWQYIPS